MNKLLVFVLLFFLKRPRFAVALLQGGAAVARDMLAVELNVSTVVLAVPRTFGCHQQLSTCSHVVPLWLFSPAWASLSRTKHRKGSRKQMAHPSWGINLVGTGTASSASSSRGGVKKFFLRYMSKNNRGS